MNIPLGLKFNELKEWIIGKRFGRLVVVEFERKYKSENRWKCLCDCGNECSRSTSNLREKRDHSCRCWGFEKSAVAVVKHGLHKSAEYNAYHAMKGRCYREKDAEFKRYGGRGIKVCDRWLESFDNFFADMGAKPGKDFSLDRIDYNGNYEPSNCRWADALTQSNNTRRNKIHVLDGIEATMAQHCRRTGANRHTVAHRLKKGMTIEEAYKKVS